MFRDFYGTPSQAKAYIGFDAAKANEMLARLNIAPNARLKTLSKGNKEKVQLGAGHEPQRPSLPAG